MKFNANYPGRIMPAYHGRRTRYRDDSNRMAPFRRREEVYNDYYTLPYDEFYVEDENLSGVWAPTEFENRDDDYEYRYEGFGPSWRFDTDNDYGLYSPDRVNDYGGYGASGYAGPYFGTPYSYGRRERIIDRDMRQPMPGRYGRSDVWQARNPVPVPPERYRSQRPNFRQPDYDYGYGRRYNDIPQRPHPQDSGAWERDSEYRRRYRY